MTYFGPTLAREDEKANDPREMVVAERGEPHSAEFVIFEDALARFTLRRGVHAVGERSVDIMSPLGPSHEDLNGVIGVPAFARAADAVDPALYVLRRQLVEAQPVPR